MTSADALRSLYPQPGERAAKSSSPRSIAIAGASSSSRRSWSWLPAARRVNGTATLSLDAADVRLCRDERREPKLVIVVSVEEAYLHCAKALVRSHLWHAESQIERSSLPTMGRTINDQTGSEAAAESHQAMLCRYQADL